MRLKSVYISEYKNLKDFTINFEQNNFIDIFVGKNGSGKSNFFEALILIFRHLYEHGKTIPSFTYKIKFEINSSEIEISWDGSQLKLNNENRSSINEKTLPDNVIVYYTGHNETVTSIIQEYQDKFSKKIKSIDFDASRKFIGIGSDYKTLLLSIMLLQTDSNKARQYICNALNISGVSKIEIHLKRPIFADDKLVIDHFDTKTHFWGTEGIMAQFLSDLTQCISEEYSHASIYDSSSDTYVINIDRSLFNKTFSASQPPEHFRLFDNLRTLGMIRDIYYKNDENSKINLSHYSDGQFQSIYIYSITQLFKDRNCITLLDEPDSFLHPEWQFDFMKQVVILNNEDTNSNHILLSSHSASTLTTAEEDMISLFEINENKVNVKNACKSDIIKSLSAGLIVFSEKELRLNIKHVLDNTTGPILFTEGISDETILLTAYKKLYQGAERDIEIQNAFSCVFLKNLLKDHTLYRNNTGRLFFGLFDFDKAYNEWNSIGRTPLLESDPLKGLCKQVKNGDSLCNGYGFMLPVPDNTKIKQQVIKDEIAQSTFEDQSKLAIELLFYGLPETESFFKEQPVIGGGNIVVFSGDKVHFAKEVVPTIDPSHFEIFRPMFDFIKSKC